MILKPLILFKMTAERAAKLVDTLTTSIEKMEERVEKYPTDIALAGQLANLRTRLKEAEGNISHEHVYTPNCNERIGEGAFGSREEIQVSCTCGAWKWVFKFGNW